MKILFTGVGRRVELIQLFRAAAQRKGMPLVIIGCDLSPTAPALAFCDRQFLVPPIASPGYIPTLLELCRREEVDALIPTIDTDLLPLAQSKDAFAAVGTRVVVSDPCLIAQCRDKRLTYELFVKAGLNAPRPVDDLAAFEDGFPAFIKPRDGSSSVHAHRADSREELQELTRRVPDYIIQPFIAGTEYTVDVFCDFEGDPIYITPRVRIGVRAGEVIKTEIRQEETVIREVRHLVAQCRPCGPMTVQLIHRGEDHTNHYIEINPRFGGGAPLSAKAGADSAEALLGLLAGEALRFLPNAARNGAHYSRYEQSISLPPADPALWQIKGVIFDMDDTLYAEKSYVKSGYRAVAAHLGDVAVAEELWQCFAEGRPAIDRVLAARGLLDRRRECVDVYRNHRPEIALFDGVAGLIGELRARGIKIGLITDGRPVGQRQKIAALGLEALVDDIIVTDELGGIAFRKPNDIAYRILQCKWGIPFEQLVYVGDNVAKDFRAPHCLGMRSIWLKNTDGVHPIVETDRPADAVAEDIPALVRILNECVQDERNGGLPG